MLCNDISIHAPHAGRDEPESGRISKDRISIHAPHAGRDGIKVNIHIGEVLFQSTRPMRGATLVSQSTAETITISIHAPHAGRDLRNTSFPFVSRISIHAPHAGRDFLL